jgi:TP901 family phage tail tape measure protein
MGKARAEIEVTASSSRLAAGLAAAQSKVTAWASAIARGTSRAVSFGLDKIRPGNMAKDAVSHFAGNMLTKGFDAVMDAASDVRDFERGLVRFQIASNGTTAATDALRTSIAKVSTETGVARSEILAGAQTYVDLTGDVAGAQAAMRSFARIAQASGASVSDVSAAAAALQQSMKLDPGDIEAVFSGLIEQGKKGAVSLKDFAGELSAVAPRFAKFGGSGIQGIADLGAALQVVRQGFGSASEAATGLEALMGAMAQNAKKFEAAGVKIFTRSKDGTKTFRGFVDIVDAIGRSKLAKDPTALSKAFGSKEAAQAFDMLTRNRSLLDEIYQAGLKSDTVQRDLMTFTSSAAGRIDLAFNNMKVSIAEAFTPERIEKFASAMEHVADLVGSIADTVDAILPGSSSDKQTAVKAAIQDDGALGRMQRINLGKQLGIDLESMTPRQRAEALAKAKGDAGAIGIENVHKASKEYLDAGGGMSPVEIIQRAERAAREARAKSAASPAEKLELPSWLEPMIRSVIPAAIKEGFESTKPTQVKIGDNQVAKSSRAATAARTRP